MARFWACRRSKSRQPFVLAAAAGSSAGCSNSTSALSLTYRPAKKAHPAFEVSNLDALRATLQAHNIKITDDDSLPGTRRFYAEDPFGNRLEFVGADCR